ncbi:hypothetical protein N657DRAFT_645239 [Parathielavia appendiculata]|uniref:Uncharacterized protein n=1 Tax=Parathielavia appendiculata TaxID=2587402 RepID=A0AAN6U0Q1_9PEZI|nr:hypothetical protein N657DRAFT_645239 [Parathielavia appendiculata]
MGERKPMEDTVLKTPKVSTTGFEKRRQWLPREGDSLSSNPQCLAGYTALTTCATESSERGLVVLYSARWEQPLFELAAIGSGQWDGRQRD